MDRAHDRRDARRRRGGDQRHSSRHRRSARGGRNAALRGLACPRTGKGDRGMSRKTDIVQAVIDAWCTRQDIDTVLSHLSEDMVWHHSAVTAPPKAGKAGAREFLTAYKAKVRNPNWRMFKIAESEDALFVEGVDEFDTADGITS
ncbi:nuclear transport factor 2 family protein [Marinicauda pacifica]|uniref:Nuclear transport factor 2 family protein n=2 Tax=Marinicauda pacifica TaxID=1133559 RepID=A0A4S2HBC8_9PROT|nr:nuclear transport factor 2 family protein [Marinicauda pacifica]